MVNNSKSRLWLCSLFGIFLSETSNAEKPNIIVILADDLGYGDVSAYGSKTIKTPNIDKLANEGICFTNGYATSATSTPSRYALMTGMYPWKNKQAKILSGDAPLIINKDQFTLPRMMKQAGYRTAAIGKWHLGMGNGKIDWNKKIEPGANEIGFDYSCLIAATVDRVPTVYVENGFVVGLDRKDPLEVDYAKAFPGEITATSNPELIKMKWSHGHNNAVINGIPRIGYMKGGKSAIWQDENMAIYFEEKVKMFLNDNKDKPFFLYYGLHQPHVPRTPNSEFIGKSGMGPRGDAILEADWCVGKLIQNLDELHLLDNTIIIFSSDNGPVLDDGYQDQAEQLKGNHDMNGGMRGGKYSLFDAGTHVPFFIYGKNLINQRHSNELICQIDILPSLASYLNIKIDKKLDGIDLSNLLFKNKNSSGRKNLILEASGRLALRYKNWSYIATYEGATTNESGNELGNLSSDGLFNLNEDRAQQINLAKHKTGMTQKLNRIFLKITKGYYKKEVLPEILK